VLTLAWRALPTWHLHTKAGLYVYIIMAGITLLTIDKSNNTAGILTLVMVDVYYMARKFIFFFKKEKRWKQWRSFMLVL